MGATSTPSKMRLQILLSLVALHHHHASADPSPIGICDTRCTDVNEYGNDHFHAPADTCMISDICVELGALIRVFKNGTCDACPPSQIYCYAFCSPSGDWTVSETCMNKFGATESANIVLPDDTEWQIIDYGKHICQLVNTRTNEPICNEADGKSKRIYPTIEEGQCDPACLYEQRCNAEKCARESTDTKQSLKCVEADTVMRYDNEDCLTCDNSTYLCEYTCYEEWEWVGPLKSCQPRDLFHRHPQDPRFCYETPRSVIGAMHRCNEKSGLRTDKYNPPLDFTWRFK